MNIFFIENKYQTEFWDVVAEQLIKYGHNINWIVQNHTFIPKNGTKFIIPYPKNKELSELPFPSADLNYIIDSDRNLNYFGVTDNKYYTYYSNKIESILLKVKPDIIFGESTLFHELLTIHHAKKHGILYLAPSGSRYPQNRFSFYKYNTLEPFGGDSIPLNNIEALSLVTSIANRTSKPAYMQVIEVSHISKMIEKFSNIYLMTKSYFGGEKYNLPSPFIKLRTEKYKEKLKKEWNKISLEFKLNKIRNNFCVLYPMQLQPEANIDVWGYPNNNQLNIVKKIIKNLPKDAYLVIKPNPKAKYELSRELLDYVSTNRQIITVPLTVSMDEIINSINIVITVTGTIAIECIMSNIPVVTLKDTINNSTRNCIYIENLDHLNTYISKVKSDTFPKITEKEMISFINKLQITSYAGIIEPSRFNSASGELSNISMVSRAFNNILQSIG